MTARPRPVWRPRFVYVTYCLWYRRYRSALTLPRAAGDAAMTRKIARHRVAALGVTVAFFVLAPAAHATPPDHSWIVNNLGATQASIGWSSRPLALVVGCAVPTLGQSRPRQWPARTPSRAPPIL